MRKKEIKHLWSRLFDKEDKVEFKNLTDQEFEDIVKVLERIKSPFNYEINRAGKTILLWKPSNPDLFFKEYGALLFLLAILKQRLLRERLKIGIGRKNKNRSKGKK